MMAVRKAGYSYMKSLNSPQNERVIYDDKDVRSFAANFAEWSLTEKLKVGDVLQDPSLLTGMANLEEGVFDHIS